MIKITAFLIIGLISLNLDERGTKLLENIQDKFNEINNLSVEFKQNIIGKALFTGTLLFKKDDKLRIEFNHSVLVSDGKTNWSYNKKENKVIISNNEESSASPFSLKKIIYDYPKECSISSESSNGSSVLVLTPNASSSIGYSLIKIWSDSNNLINKVVLKDNADNLIQIEFFKYKLNQKVLDSKFIFYPPEGSKVIDLRQ